MECMITVFGCSRLSISRICGFMQRGRKNCGSGTGKYRVRRGDGLKKGCGAKRRSTADNKVFAALMLFSDSYPPAPSHMGGGTHRFGFSSYEGAVRGSRRLPKRTKHKNSLRSFYASFVCARSAPDCVRGGATRQSREKRCHRAGVGLAQAFPRACSVVSASIMRKCRTDAARRFYTAKHGT